MAVTDEVDLLRGIARLSRVATGEFHVDAILRELCWVAGPALGVDGVGVMSASEDGLATSRIRFVDADDPLTVRVEQLQAALQEGPCRDAVQQGGVVAVGDVRREHLRWPNLVTEVLEAELRAVAAVPLRSRGRTWGTLDLFRRDPGDWQPQELESARFLADVAVSYIVMADDRDQARAAQQEVAHRSMHDQLTGLPNRALLIDRIDHALATAARRGTAVALIFLDLDRFKEINDAFGHAAGDEVLVEVSRRMVRSLRQGDTLGRLAGDEFIVLCEDLSRDPTTFNSTIGGIVERLRSALAEPVVVDGVGIKISVSMGVSANTVAETTDQLLDAADNAMYGAKRAGRSTVVVQGTADAPSGHGRELLRDLGHALDRAELRVHYQPIFDIADRIVAVEALVRWQHPQQGLLDAAAFVEVAHASGELARIGPWVIERSCADLAGWRQEFGRRAPGMVFCNLSPAELSDPALATAISNSLGAHDLAPADLVLEIVESAFADPTMLETLNRYVERGHDLSVDDFGTGYSSLSRLIALPATYAKIDRAFIAGLPSDERSRAFVDAVVIMARSLQLRVIGEGVETDPQRIHLIDAECDLVQGFHLARPMPAERLAALLRDERPSGDEPHTSHLV